MSFLIPTATAVLGLIAGVLLAPKLTTEERTLLTDLKTFAADLRADLAKVPADAASYLTTLEAKLASIKL